MDKNTMTDDEYLAFYASTYNDLVKKLKDSRRESSVTTAIELLLGRLVCAGQSIDVLRKHAIHMYAFDGIMILRSMYDTMLQALYILSDPTQQESRATQYLDYYWVEKRKMISIIDRSTTYAGQRISRSVKRATAEPEIDKEFQRVRKTYQNAKGNLPRYWYGNDLRAIAKDEYIDLESEYEIMQKQLSAAVHSSSFALREPTFFSDKVPLMMFACKFIFRVLRKFADYNRLSLEKHESDLLDFSMKNIFSDPSERL